MADFVNVDAVSLVPSGQGYVRAIAGVKAEVTLSESGRDELVITEHPVEQGAPIADHAYKRPSEIVIQAGWSESGMTWQDMTAPSGIYGWLLGVQAAFNPFDVYTGKRKYTNMLLQSIEQETDQHSEHVLMVQLVLREIILTSTKAASGPTGMSTSSASQTNPADTAPPADTGSQQVGNPTPVPGTPDTTSINQVPNTSAIDNPISTTIGTDTDAVVGP